VTAIRALLLATLTILPAALLLAPGASAACASQPVDAGPVTSEAHACATPGVTGTCNLSPLPRVDEGFDAGYVATATVPAGVDTLSVTAGPQLVNVGDDCAGTTTYPTFRCDVRDSAALVGRPCAVAV